MPRTGRPPNPQPPGSLHVTIPQWQVDFLDTLTLDPITQRPKMGARTALISELLRQLECAFLYGAENASFEPALAMLQQYVEES